MAQRSKPCPKRPELKALMQKSVEQMRMMSNEEIEAMLRTQRDGYVRAEMSWPSSRVLSRAEQEDGQ